MRLHTRRQAGRRARALHELAAGSELQLHRRAGFPFVSPPPCSALSHLLLLPLPLPLALPLHPASSACR